MGQTQIPTVDVIEQFRSVEGDLLRAAEERSHHGELAVVTSIVVSNTNL
jgi:hypothetical protein